MDSTTHQYRKFLQELLRNPSLLSSLRNPSLLPHLLTTETAHHANHHPTPPPPYSSAPPTPASTPPSPPPSPTSAPFLPPPFPNTQHSFTFSHTAAADAQAEADTGLEADAEAATADHAPDQDDEQEEQEADTLTINATTLVSGHGNTVTLDAAAIGARVAHALVAVLGYAKPRQHDRPDARSTPVSAFKDLTASVSEAREGVEEGERAGMGMARRRRPLRVRLDCGVRVVGSRNFVQGLGGGAVKRKGWGKGDVEVERGVKRARGEGEGEGEGEGGRRCAGKEEVVGNVEVEV